MGALTPYLLTALGAITGPDTSPDLSPLTIFRSVCIEGGSSLPRDAAAVARFDDIKASGRSAFAHSTGQGFQPVPKLSNTIYRIRASKPVFLILPLAGAAQSDAYGQSCAVVWKGDQYLEAKKTIIPRPDPPGLKMTIPSDTPMGFAYTATDDGDLKLSVSAWGGWTAMRSARSEGIELEKSSRVDSRQ